MNKIIKIVVALMLMLAIVVLAIPAAVSADSEAEDSYQKNLDAMKRAVFAPYTILYNGIVARTNEICKNCLSFETRIQGAMNVDVTPPDNTDVPIPDPTPEVTPTPEITPTPTPTEPPV